MIVQRNFTLGVLGGAAVLSGMLGYVPAGLGAPLGGPAAEPAWGVMLMHLFGGLALFLFGMEQMADGLKAAAGSKMKDLLGRLTKNRIAGAFTGATVTAVIQSSSVTTVLVVGFVSAGLMTLSQSVGVIMGANVGTTITAQIVAFKVEKAALFIIAVGFAMLFLSDNEKIKHYGNIIMGLGLVFFGMSIMSEGMSPLRTYQPFIDLMVRMEAPILGILVGAVFTALVQSSSATTGIVIAMASQGLISLPAGIALILGSNIGTCITALLASAGKSVEALRVAMVHVLFNVLGVMIWMFLIPQLAAVVSEFSPTRPDLAGAAKLAAEVPRQIANAHTTFNVANTIFFIFFTTQVARLAERLVPERVEPEKVIIKPKFLDPELVETPSLALDRVRMEIGHLGEIVDSMLLRIREAFLDRSHGELEAVAALDDKADILHMAILDYLNELMKTELSSEDNALVMKYIRVSEDLERIGDVIAVDLVEMGHFVAENEIDASETIRHILEKLYREVTEGLTDAIKSITENDELAAQNVINMKPQVNAEVERALVYQAERMTAHDAEAMSLTRIENDIMDGLKRIYSLSKRIAKLAVPQALRETAD